MQFWFPGFLIASAAVLIPVIVHLFSFRASKKVYFSDIRFLREVKEENRQKTRLRHLLVLLCRALALIMLVLAFAKPFFGDTQEIGNAGPRVVDIFVDNSYSMDAESGAGINLEIAKAKASSIANAYEETDRFRLITQDLSTSPSRLLSREEFNESLSRISPGPESHNLQEITEWMKLNSPKKKETYVHYIISDFQSSATQLEKFRQNSDTDLRYTLVPVEKGVRGNISIDSVWLSEPFALGGEAAKLNVQVHNHGESESGEIPISLQINGIQKAVGTTNLSSGEVKSIELSYLHAARGWQLGEVKITDPETPFDNSMFFSYEVIEKSSVLQLSEDEFNPYLRSLFKIDSLIDYSEMNTSEVNYEKLASFDLILLNNWKNIPGGLAEGLSRALAEGVTVAVFPPERNLDFRSYQTFLQAQGAGWYLKEDTADTEITDINYGNELFKGVFSESRQQHSNIKLPKILNHYLITQNTVTSRDVALTYRDGSAFIAGFQAGAGKVFLISVALSDACGNFHRHGLFVPCIFRLAFQRRFTTEISVNAGRKEPFILRGQTLQGDQMPTMNRVGTSEKIIPIAQYSGGLTRIFLENHIKNSGHYSLSLSGQDTLGFISVNHQRLESEQRFHNTEELESFCSKNKNFRIAETSTASGGKKEANIYGTSSDWRIFLFFSLIFLFFELVLLKIKT